MTVAAAAAKIMQINLGWLAGAHSAVFTIRNNNQETASAEPHHAWSLNYDSCTRAVMDFSCEGMGLFLCFGVLNLNLDANNWH
jgi:hypothetical protein